jgi:hypothetical protein
VAENLHSHRNREASKTVARADGRVAIVLDTQERGPIAFEVNLQSIDMLRRELARAETLLRQTTGKA